MSTVTQRTVDTPTLRVAYWQWDPLDSANDKTVLLLHGWPDSPRSWFDVAPLLTKQGYRVLAPYLRGYGDTRFQDPSTPRSGQLAALGRDLLEFIEALNLDKPVLVGHDWGARAVANACGLSKGIASHLVMISVGYGTNNPNQTLSLTQARNYWYHWYMATPRGAKAMVEERHAFAQLMWDTWAPKGWYTQAEFNATALAWDNPDWADVVVSSYTHRWGHASADDRYLADEALLDPAPVLAVPTLMLHGEVDGANHPITSANKEAFFSSTYLRKVLPGIGHFPQREAPALVAQEIIEFLRTTT